MNFKHRLLLNQKDGKMGQMEIWLQDKLQIINSIPKMLKVNQVT